MRHYIRIITIPEYILKVKMSEKRKPSYYEMGKKKIPKKYLNKRFRFVSYHTGKGFTKLFLTDLKTGNKVIANPRSVGTHRYESVNGQGFSSGFSSPYIRNRIVRAIKQSYVPHLRGIQPIESFPIGIDMELHAPRGNNRWDLSNLWVYNKYFEDTLVDLGIIPDDSVDYITKTGAPEYTEVETSEQRKLIFKIYCDNKRK